MTQPPLSSSGEGVIFGAGKIGRGFLAHLLQLSGMDICFVETSDTLVSALREQGRYRIEVSARPEKSTDITGYRCLSLSEEDLVVQAVAPASVVFTAVGGQHLAEVAPALAAGYVTRVQGNGGPLNCITCENWYRPARELREKVLALVPANARHAVDSIAGFSEATVLRSCMEPPPGSEPLLVQVQDYWELQIDATPLKGSVDVKGIVPLDDFYGRLERKLFTYNAASATVSYLGYLKGYEYLADAAHDAAIERVLTAVYAESGQAIRRRYGYSEKDQADFAASSRRKLQDHSIRDTVIRNARDPIRKLGRDDRLIGPACLALEYDIEPRGLALAIAAALRYDAAGDPAAARLQELRRAHGLHATLSEACGIDPKGRLALLVEEQAARLDAILDGKEEL